MTDAFPSNGIQIRRAVESDLPAIMALERECSGASHWTENAYQAALTPAENRLLLVLKIDRTTDGNQIAGFLVARQIGAEWELENLAVAPDFRRSGLGTRLLSALLERGKGMAAQAIFLEVRESNMAARGLYEAAGFKQSGRRKSYYVNPIEDALLYTFRY